MTRSKLCEGKTKIIWQDPDDPGLVLIESKDDITAGDGTRRNVLPGKGALANRTTCNCFELLHQRNSVASHYLGRVNDATFRARLVKMIPIELVARRRATGSYLKRNPTVTEGTTFVDLELEHFLKDDARHDPLITYDLERSVRILHDPTMPVGSAILAEEPIKNPRQMEYHITNLNLQLSLVFILLEKAWRAQNVVLVDLKIECGRDPATGEILVADVIDNDSWRIWPDGRKEAMLDKQVYRDLPDVTDEKLSDILAKYATVANATDRFLL